MGGGGTCRDCSRLKRVRIVGLRALWRPSSVIEHGLVGKATSPLPLTPVHSDWRSESSSSVGMNGCGRGDGPAAEVTPWMSHRQGPD
jgi:hypothetical protein